MILAIPPFNYPVNLAVSKIAPALIAGNSIVLKPPTQVIIFFIVKFSKALHIRSTLSQLQADHVIKVLAGIRLLQ